ncbi:hypothetical protein DFS33DRAFT_1369256 [Desarmillaria ectypa]|nr:hypothetical protein DFS33DRAFT_1369256 [Desarmillaria ectypa]
MGLLGIILWEIRAFLVGNLNLMTEFIFSSTARQKKVLPGISVFMYVLAILKGSSHYYFTVFYYILVLARGI